MIDAENEMQTSIKNFPATSREIGAFANLDNFQAAQRMAQALVSSSLVPADYRGKENLGNAVIALSMAQRIGADPMMVMQNLYVVHGKPAWSAQFVISAINSCGRFSPLRFDLNGDGDSRTCVAWVREKGSGDRLEGPPVSMVMAKAEGWIQKKGSKWQTMPEVMLRYRAASFFGRMYAPDILMGMQTQEEIRDVYDTAPVEVVDEETGEVTRTYETKTASVAEKVAQAAQAAKEAQGGADDAVTMGAADELAARVQTTQDAAALDEIEDLARSLADPAEHNAVLAIIEKRRGVLGG